jgi:phage FluMu protein Com
MSEIRCPKCGRLLCKGKIVMIEIKCPKCGYLHKATGNKEKP